MVRTVVLAAVTVAGYLTTVLAPTERLFNPELTAFLASMPPPTQAAPASVTGAWDIVVSVPDAPLSLYAEWKQNGGAFSGTVYAAQDELKVTGTVEANTVKFELYLSGVTIRLSGEVKGDTIAGKANHASAGQVDWTATRAKQQ